MAKRIELYSFYVYIHKNMYSSNKLQLAIRWDKNIIQYAASVAARENYNKDELKKYKCGDNFQTNGISRYRLIQEYQPKN